MNKVFKFARYYCCRLFGFFAYYSKEECVKAFVDYMNERARAIGAKTATFGEPSGYWSKQSKASARDMLHIFVHAAGIRQITEIWNKREYEMCVTGPRKRTVTIKSTVNYDKYDASLYPVLGVKTGTEPGVTYNLALCACVPDGRSLAYVCLGASDDDARWRDAMLVMESFQKGNPVLLSEVSASSVAVCQLPSNPIMYDNFGFELFLDKDIDVLGIPASLTKIMSLICAVDYISCFDEKVKICQSDIVLGSGNNLKKGDLVTLKDLFYDMLLPSSNTAAMAIARHIGRRILKSRR